MWAVRSSELPPILLQPCYYLITSFGDEAKKLNPSFCESSKLSSVRQCPIVRDKRGSFKKHCLHNKRIDHNFTQDYYNDHYKQLWGIHNFLNIIVKKGINKLNKKEAENETQSKARKTSLNS